MDDPVFMKALDAAVYYAVNLGMCVIINTHFEQWIHNHYDGTEAYKGKFWGLWRNIVTRYKSIKQSDLVVELLNEPNSVLGAFSLGNCNDPKAVELTRSIMKVGFDGVRSVDPTRMIALSSNGMQSVCQCPVIYPTRSLLPGGGNDKYLMVAVHDYVPWNYCGESESNDFYLKQKDPYGAMQNDINKLFDDLKAWHNGIGGDSVVGLLVTEFGVGCSNNSGRRNTDLVRAWYRQTAKACRDRKIGPCAWNDCSKTSWFGLSTLPSETNGKVEWLYGLADATLGY